MTPAPLRIALALLSLFAGQCFAAAGNTVDIPYSLTELENGLTVIVHEDRKAPVVAVNIWYHVGSKNEVPGRTGFAHLFEHLMFQGSENFEEDYISTLQKLGASELNGTTWFDRTNYFETVPKNALDKVLWLESDRMGHFANAISQEKLDEQRGVVQNEKRQGENQPYGRVWETILRNVFPERHPYSWETIGSMEDLNAATLEDVRDWFRTYYGPNNAVIVIAGDIDTASAVAKVRTYFGDIPPGPPLTKPGRWIPRHADERRATMQDRVPQPRLYKVWAGPEWGSADAVHVSLAATILGGDKNSRLYERLVYRDQIATDAAVAPMAFEIAGITYLVLSAQPGHTLTELEAAADEELARFIEKGPTRDELERARVGARAAFLRGIETVGGQSGKSGILASNMVYGGAPDLYKRELELIASATRDDLQRAAGRWLDNGAFALEVTPYPDIAPAATAADRSAPPQPGPAPQVEFPEFRRTQLDNGLNVIITERPDSPLVSASLLIDAGYASDQFTRQGTAKIAMSMLDEGTDKRSALEISEALALQGAQISAGSSLDVSFIGLAALRENIDASLELFADIALNPAFPKDELERARKIALTAIQQEKNRPTSMGLRVLPRLLYGEKHPYGQPFTGSGTEETVIATQVGDLRKFHETWFKPNHATLIVVGGVPAEEMLAKLDALFGDWDAGEVPDKRLAGIDSAAGDTLYVVDRPDADQSVIFAGLLMPPKANDDEVALQAMNDILGGTFAARINMNLREDKHWSYGAYSFITDARGDRPLIAYAQVQTDKTSESINELRKEISGIRSERPPTAEELQLVKDTRTLSLPGRWEASGSVLASLGEIVEFDLPDDHWDGFAARINALTLDDVRQSAIAHIDPRAVRWVVVGDRASIEEDIRALGFSEVRFIDADGLPVGP